MNKLKKTYPDGVGVPFLLAGGNPKWRPSESPTFMTTRPKLSDQLKETRGRPRKNRTNLSEEPHEEE